MKDGIRLLNDAQEMMKRVIARMAARMVQKQSVHLLSFYSTGRFPKRYTFLANIYFYNYEAHINHERSTTKMSYIITMPPPSTKSLLEFTRCSNLWLGH